MDRAASLGQKRAPILGIQTAIYMFMIYAAYALAFWYGIHLFAKGEAESSGKVITTLFSIIIGTNAFAQLAGYVGSFFKIATAGVELLKVIDAAPSAAPKGLESPEPNSQTLARTGGLKVGRENQDIAFKNITFSYPLRPGVPVLKNFSLNVPAGKITALIGPSGSGKSTVVGLLERWYDADEGIVQLGSTNINEIPAGGIRGEIGLVQQVCWIPSHNSYGLFETEPEQEPFLFSGSVLENVLYGLPRQMAELLSDSEKQSLVVDACKVANAHDFVQFLPEVCVLYFNRRLVYSNDQRNTKSSILDSSLRQLMVMVSRTAPWFPKLSSWISESI